MSDATKCMEALKDFLKSKKSKDFAEIETLKNCIEEIQDALNHVEFEKKYDIRFKNVHNLSYADDFFERLVATEQKDLYSVACFNIHNFTKVNKTLGEEVSSYCLEKFFEGLKDVIGITGKDGEDGAVTTVESDTGIVFYKQDLQIHILNYFRETEIDYSECAHFKPTGENSEQSGKLVLSAHAGIITDLAEFNTSAELIEAMRAALGVSRKLNGPKIIFYDDELREKVDTQKQIEDLFLPALKTEEFMVYYQPKIDLHDYSLKGAEALVRWKRGDQMIFPNNFIPSLESNYSIKYLDMYMLNHICADIEEWLKKGKKVPQISVNLSRATLTIPNLKELILNTIAKYDIPRSLVQVELTESASYTSNDELKPLVMGLSENGISTAVDDFGTGFSSLSLIRELPWDVLKIDKSLLKGIQRKGSREEKMFRSIISMAHEIGLECIVEGVETREDVRILKESGCFYAQGFYFSKPIPKEEFEAKIPKLAPEKRDARIGGGGVRTTRIHK